MSYPKIKDGSYIYILLYLALTAIIARYSVAVTTVIILIVLIVVLYQITIKVGKENLLIITMPVQRIFIEIGFALKPFYLVIALIIFIYLVKSALSLRVEKSIFAIRKPDSFFLLCLLFVLSLLFATVINGAHVVSFRHIIVLIIVITGAFFVYRSINSFSDISKLFDVYLVTGLIMGVIGLLLYGLFFINPGLCSPGSLFEGVTFDYERAWSWPLLQSVEISSNAYAMTLLPFMFIAIYKFKIEWKLSRKIYIAFIFALLFVNLLLSFSRAGVMAFFAAYFTLILIRLKSIKSWVMLFAIIFVFIIGWPVIMELYKIYSIMKGSSPGSEVVMLSNRDELLLRSWEIYLQHPLFGVGQGLIVEPEYLGKQSHNTYIELLAENGIFVFTIFILICAIVIKRIIAVYKLIIDDSSLNLYFTPLVLGFIALTIAIIPTSAITSLVLWVHFAVILAFHKVVVKEGVLKMRSHLLV